MTDPATLPPARERNRYGIRAYTENSAADAAEALLDRVEIRVRGTLEPRSHEGVRRFVERVGSSSGTPALFGRAHRHKNRWRANVLGGSTITSGKLAIWDQELSEGFELILQVNPIRTLGHLLDCYSFEDIDDLSPSEFFARRPEPTAASRTLDGQDNIVTDFLAFSGSLHTVRLQRVASYLRLFEAQLGLRIVEGLCPPEHGYQTSGGSGVIRAENDDVLVQLDWGSLTVSQCEPCWERHDPLALERVHAMADAVLLTARSGEVNLHPDQPSVQRDLGALSVRLPLPGKMTLVVYAKAVDRLRFEVRYRSDLPDMVRDSLPSPPRRLMDWFDAIREHAASRIRWEDISRMLSPPEEPTIDALAELLEAVADVTDKAKSKRRGLLRQLLLHGAVTATPRDGPAPSTLLTHLADRGVLEHVRLINRDAKTGRRYRLAPRYLGLVGWTSEMAGTDPV